MRKSPRKNKSKAHATNNNRNEIPQKSKGSSKRKEENYPVWRNSHQKNYQKSSDKQINYQNSIGILPEKEKKLLQEKR